MRAGRRIFFAALGLVASWPGLAGVVDLAPGAVDRFEAGYFCRQAPDAVQKMPHTAAGELQVFNQPFNFVSQGDTAPSVPGIGIGVVMWLDNFVPREKLTIQSAHGEPCCGNVETWLAYPDEQGLIWLGYLTDDVTPFQPGPWRFTVKRGDRVLFIYDFQVQPLSGFSGPPSPCQTPVVG